EHSLVTVDVANARGGSDNPFQSFGGVQARNAGHGSSLAVRIDVGCSAAQKRRHCNPLLYANREVVSKRTPGFVIGQFVPRSGLARGFILKALGLKKVMLAELLHSLRTHLRSLNHSKFTAGH